MSADSIAAARLWKETHDKGKHKEDQFPLTVHVSGRWVKKYKKGAKWKLFYYGAITDDVEASAWAAYDVWLKQKERDKTGRKRVTHEGDGPTVASICDAFLTSKSNRASTGEISPHTLLDYTRICKLLVTEFGDRPIADLQAEDFEQLRRRLADKGNALKADDDRSRKGLGLIALGNHIQRIRTVLRSARDGRLNELLLDCFRKPTRKAVRIQKAERGPRMFESSELRTLLDKAGPQLKAMMLLALNVGFGNSDCGQLPINRINLVTGWHDFPRPKTGVQRRAPLWPETVAALKVVLAKRKAPVDQAHAGQLFVTKRGGTWAKETADSPISKEFTKLLKATGIPSNSRNFYTLRHVFRTIGDRSRDQVACNFIMGHVDNTMAGEYREAIEDDRLKAVVNQVRAWLFPKVAKGKKAKPEAAKPAAAAKPPKAKPNKRHGAVAEMPTTLKLFTGKIADVG